VLAGVAQGAPRIAPCRADRVRKGGAQTSDGGREDTRGRATGRIGGGEADSRVGGHKLLVNKIAMKIRAREL
jgi:hypothetical protein